MPGPRSTTILHTVIIMSVVYVGLPLYFHFFPAQVSPGPAESPSSQPPNSSPPPLLPQSPDTGHAQFNFGTVVAALSFVLSLTTTAAGALVRLLGLLILPTYHAYFAVVYVLHVFASVLGPVIEPIILATNLIFSIILSPLFLLYRIGAALYPLYVFLGAACVCGAVVGLFARISSGFILQNAIGVRISSQSDGLVIKKEADEKRRVRVLSKGKSRM